MITAVLVALIGNEVFPGHTGWWIIYVVVSAIFKIISLAIDMVMEKCF